MKKHNVCIKSYPPVSGSKSKPYLKQCVDRIFTATKRGGTITFSAKLNWNGGVDKIKLKIPAKASFLLDIDMLVEFYVIDGQFLYFLYSGYVNSKKEASLDTGLIEYQIKGLYHKFKEQTIKYYEKMDNPSLVNDLVLTSAIEVNKKSRFNFNIILNSLIHRDTKFTGINLEDFTLEDALKRAMPMYRVVDNDGKLVYKLTLAGVPARNSNSIYLCIESVSPATIRLREDYDFNDYDMSIKTDGIVNKVVGKGGYDKSKKDEYPPYQTTTTVQDDLSISMYGERLKEVMFEPILENDGMKSVCLDMIRENKDPVRKIKCKKVDILKLYMKVYKNRQAMNAVNEEKVMFGLHSLLQRYKILTYPREDKKNLLYGVELNRFVIVKGQKDISFVKSSDSLAGGGSILMKSNSLSAPLDAYLGRCIFKEKVKAVTKIKVVYKNKSQNYNHTLRFLEKGAGSISLTLSNTGDNWKTSTFDLSKVNVPWSGTMETAGDDDLILLPKLKEQIKVDSSNDLIPVGVRVIGDDKINIKTGKTLITELIGIDIHSYPIDKRLNGKVELYLDFIEVVVYGPLVYEVPLTKIEDKYEKGEYVATLIFGEERDDLDASFYEKIKFGRTAYNRFRTPPVTSS